MEKDQHFCRGFGLKTLHPFPKNLHLCVPFSACMHGRSVDADTLLFRQQQYGCGHLFVQERPIQLGLQAAWCDPLRPCDYRRHQRVVTLTT